MNSFVVSRSIENMFSVNVFKVMKISYVSCALATIIIHLSGCHGKQLTTAAMNVTNTHFHKELSMSVIIQAMNMALFSMSHVALRMLKLL